MRLLAVLCISLVTAGVAAAQQATPTPIPVIQAPEPSVAELQAHAQEVIRSAGADAVFTVRTTDEGGVSARHEPSGLLCGSNGLISIRFNIEDGNTFFECIVSRQNTGMLLRSEPRAGASSLDDHFGRYFSASTSNVASSRSVDESALGTMFRPGAFRQRRAGTIAATNRFVRVAVADVGDWRYTLVFDARNSYEDRVNFLMAEMSLLFLLSGAPGARADLEAAGIAVPAE